MNMARNSSRSATSVPTLGVAPPAGMREVGIRPRAVARRWLYASPHHSARAEAPTSPLFLGSPGDLSEGLTIRLRAVVRGEEIQPLSAMARHVRIIGCGTRSTL